MKIPKTGIMRSICHFALRSGRWAIHREMRKSRVLVNRFLYGHPDTMRHKGESSKETWAWLLPACYAELKSNVLRWICEGDYVGVRFLKQVFLSVYLLGKKRGWKKHPPFLEFVGLLIAFNKIICLPMWYFLGRLPPDPPPQHWYVSRK